MSYQNWRVVHIKLYQCYFNVPQHFAKSCLCLVLHGTGPELGVMVDNTINIFYSSLMEFLANETNGIQLSIWPGTHDRSGHSWAIIIIGFCRYIEEKGTFWILASSLGLSHQAESSAKGRFKPVFIYTILVMNSIALSDKFSDHSSHNCR